MLKAVEKGFNQIPLPAPALNHPTANYLHGHALRFFLPADPDLFVAAPNFVPTRTLP
jgi:hypothetical protein